jgi:KUP system potassium uptake protein
LLFDLSFFGANLFKVADGGWLTLLCATFLTIVMTTWRRGREEIVRRIGTRMPLETFLKDVAV